MERSQNAKKKPYPQHDVSTGWPLFYRVQGRRLDSDVAYQFHKKKRKQEDPKNKDAKNTTGKASGTGCVLKGVKKTVRLHKEQ